VQSYTTDDFIEARKKLFENVRAEMLGPGSEDIGPDINSEVISDSPIKRYSIGILYPQESRIERENNELLVTDSSEDLEGCETNSIREEGKDFDIKSENRKTYVSNGIPDIEGEVDEDINMANQYFPSSMGMTFFIKGKTDKMNVRIECAKYRVSTYEDCCVAFKGITNEDLINPVFNEYLYCKDDCLRLKKNISYEDINILKKTGFMEKYLGLENAIYHLFNQCSNDKMRKYGYVRLPIKFGDPYYTVPITKKYERYKLEPSSGLELAVVKREYQNNIISITIILINTLKGHPAASNTFFQPQIQVVSQDNPEMIFAEYFSNLSNMGDVEEEKLSLLYREKKTYATGHGVSVVQEVDIVGKGIIRTDYMPLYEVPSIDFDIDEIKDIASKVLPMKSLSDISEYNKVDQIIYLRKFVKTYSLWCNKLKEDLNKMDVRFHETGNKHIADCEKSCSRMEKGINLLESDETVYTAFLLTNRAMLMQRVHSNCKERYPGEGAVEKYNYSEVSAKNASWRPFQLAFILMCIDSIENVESEDRDILDLIWVPTGGGKTEAYLGLTAFTIFLRRLKEPVNGGGTAIIMRYTLRLLAAQQFVRSSILICACEIIRRESTQYNLGKEPITIGLWIGKSSTPNTKAEAKECVNKLYNAQIQELEHTKNRYNKFQLLKCPWCGTKLVKEIKDNKFIGRWGYGTGKYTLFCPEQDCAFDGHLPIQVVDEDIYKTPPTLLFGTVDKFAMMTWNGDISRLFALDNGNMNKSPELIIQDELHLISGPLGTVVGLYETAIDLMCSYKGVKPKMIASTATIRRAEEQCWNLYNRIVKQFPSPGLSSEDSFFVREVDVRKKPGRLYCGIMSAGKTQTTVEIRLMAALLQKIHMMDIPDEIKDKYWTLITYFNSIRELGKCSTLVDDDIKDAMRRLASRLGTRNKTRLIVEAEELTGRVASGMITKTLDNLETEYSKSNFEEKKYAVNVLLASNMISVGVDVPRLSLMLIVGQPKLTSEYIQASSRVGRRYPGLVFTLFDGARSRDRSHFEQFYSYHQSFYRYVEPTSVTPFSEPVRDRALHAVLISMMRHIGGLNADDLAGAFNVNDSIVKHVENYILERVKDIDDSLVDDTKKDIKEIWKEWEERIYSLTESEFLSYTKEDQKHLIKPFGKSDGVPSFETLQSMRNVDVQSAANILVFGDDDDEEN